MVHIVCSCCLRAKGEESYDEIYLKPALKSHRCKECVAENRLLPGSNPNNSLSLEEMEEFNRQVGRQAISTISIEEAKQLMPSVPDCMYEALIPDQNGNLTCPFRLPHQWETCSKCGKKSTKECPLKACTKCKRYFYCSKVCQTKDWRRHKREECEKRRGRYGFCGKCSREGTSEQPLKACIRCDSFYYCSKDCQKDDWRRHKKECCKKKTPPTSPPESVNVAPSRVF